MEKKLTGAVDIGGTKIQVGIVDCTGCLLTEESFPSDSNKQSPQQAMERIIASLEKQCKDISINLSQLYGLGISCCGPVDMEKGTVENPYTLPGWLGFPIVDYLSTRLKLVVKLENDANGALLGEIFQRKLYDNRVLAITIGTGIGVAYWNQGELNILLIEWKNCVRMHG